MIDKVILNHKIKKAHGNFSTFMTKKSGTKDVVRVLKYAARQANEDQSRLVGGARP